MNGLTVKNNDTSGHTSVAQLLASEWRERVVGTWAYTGPGAIWGSRPIEAEVEAYVRDSNSKTKWIRDLFPEGATTATWSSQAFGQFSASLDDDLFVFKKKDGTYEMLVIQEKIDVEQVDGVTQLWLLRIPDPGTHWLTGWITGKRVKPLQAGHGACFLQMSC